MVEKQAEYYWRTKANKWTDTLFSESLLKNPSMLTSSELAKALTEYQLWRTGREKYDYKVDPSIEGKEDEPPFSPRILSNIIVEIIARLEIAGDLALGRLQPKKGYNA